MNIDILKIYEFKEGVMNNINNSNLPAVVIKYILKDLLYEIEQIENQQYQELKTQEHNSEENKEEGGKE